MVVAGVALVLIATAACSDGDGDGDATQSAFESAGEPSTGATSPPDTDSAGEQTAATAETLGPPVVGPGPCPYLDEVYVEETVGQRIARVETVTSEGQPAPDCVFYRPDDAAAVAVDITPYADDVAAQNAALAAVTQAAQPITDLGDYGGVLVSAGQTLLAVTSGVLLLVVTTNQESSLQARQLASAALAGITAG